MKRIDPIDYIGKVFGYLTVIGGEMSSNRKKPEMQAICKCVCGSEYKIRFNALKNGHSKSCGCMRKHLVSISNATKGGRSYHPIINVHYHMIRRCYDKKCKSYHNYGLRGITVCDQWRNDKYAFLDWAIANGWKKGLQLDRSDNDGNYSPDNCRFVTPKQNSLNKRDTIRVIYNNELKTLKEISDETGINYNTLHYRLRYGNGVLF